VAGGLRGIRMARHAVVAKRVPGVTRGVPGSIDFAAAPRDRASTPE
jgi:hypothetical protein